jgi:DNA-binding FadR family transcriptional regulator
VFEAVLLIIRRSWVRAPPAPLTCLLAVRNQRILIAWDARQADGARRAAIETGELAPGDALPSVPDLAQLQGLKPGTIRHMFNALAESGLVRIRHGRTTTVAGEPEGDTKASGRLRLTRPQYGHD